MAGYHLSSYIVELADIPKKTDVGLMKITDRMSTEAGITNFDVAQIEFEHRTPRNRHPLLSFFYTEERSYELLLSIKKVLFT